MRKRRRESKDLLQVDLRKFGQHRMKGRSGNGGSLDLVQGVSHAFDQIVTDGLIERDQEMVVHGGFGSGTTISVIGDPFDLRERPREIAGPKNLFLGEPRLVNH